jgi:quinone-modifying oxidoreductase, subunit QmoB
MPDRQPPLSCPIFQRFLIDERDMSNQDVNSDTSVELDLLPVLVLGGGYSGCIAAKALTDVGLSVTLVRTPAALRHLYCAIPGVDSNEYLQSLRAALGNVEMLDQDESPDIHRGTFGFEAIFSGGARRNFGAVFITGEVSQLPLTDSLAEGVEHVSPGALNDGGGSMAFLLDYGFPSAPAVGMTAIRQALENVSAGGTSFVIFRHIPVAHLFGESLYREAKSAGVLFIRFGDRLPVISAEGGARFRIVATDMIQGGAEFNVDCDRVFIAGAPDPASLTLPIQDTMRVERDTDGFLIKESIHCHPGSSFSNGIYVLGEATGNLDLVRIQAEAAAAAANARAWMIEAASKQHVQNVSLNDQCCRCLTCLRVCPHTAILLQPGPARSAVQEAAAACKECGICVSECPRLALDLASYPEEAVSSFLEELKQTDASEMVVIYGCQRSAGRASAQVDLPPNSVFLAVPCAGRISEAIIWATLALGVKGVLVVGCHHGNCASDSGTDWATARVASVLQKLNVSESVPSPVRYVTVAANEPARFRRVVAEFVSSLERAKVGAVSVNK